MGRGGSARRLSRRPARDARFGFPFPQTGKAKSDWKTGP